MADDIGHFRVVLEAEVDSKAGEALEDGFKGSSEKIGKKLEKEIEKSIDKSVEKAKKFERSFKIPSFGQITEKLTDFLGESVKKSTVSGLTSLYSTKIPAIENAKEIPSKEIERYAGKSEYKGTSYYSMTQKERLQPLSAAAQTGESTGGIVGMITKIAILVGIAALIYDVIKSLAPIVALFKLITAILQLTLYPVAQFFLTIFKPIIYLLLVWFIIPFYQYILPIIQKFGDWLMKNKVGAGIGGGIGAIAGFIFGGPIGAVLGAIIGAVLGAIFEEIYNYIKGWWDKSTFWTDVYNYIKGWWDSSHFWNDTYNAIKDWWNSSHFWSDTYNAIVNWWNSSHFWSDVYNYIKGWWDKSHFWSDVYNYIKGWWDKFSWKKLIEPIENAWKNFSLEKIYETIKNAILGRGSTGGGGGSGGNGGFTGGTWGQTISLNYWSTPSKYSNDPIMHMSGDSSTGKRLEVDSYLSSHGNLAGFINWAKGDIKGYLGFNWLYDRIFLNGVELFGPGFAEGGIATKPTFGVFGEAGPEALIPLKKFDMMGGGVTVNGPLVRIDSVEKDIDIDSMIDRIQRELYVNLKRSTAR